MPTMQKRVQAIGREPIPKFARFATLCWGYPIGTNQAEFPEAESIYNIAALAFYRHPAAGGGITPMVAEPESVSYWSTHTAGGVSHLFGRYKTTIPHHCEWYSVAWLRLPAANLVGLGPYYEDVFRVAWELAL